MPGSVNLPGRGTEKIRQHGLQFFFDMPFHGRNLPFLAFFVKSISQKSRFL